MQGVYTQVLFRKAESPLDCSLAGLPHAVTLDHSPCLPLQALPAQLKPLWPHALLLSIPELANYVKEEDPCRNHFSCEICKARLVLTAFTAGDEQALRRMSRGIQDKGIMQGLTRILLHMLQQEAFHRKIEFSKPPASTILALAEARCHCGHIEASAIKPAGMQCPKCHKRFDTDSLAVITYAKGKGFHKELKLKEAVFVPHAVVGQDNVFVQLGGLWFDFIKGRVVGQGAVQAIAAQLVIWRKPFAADKSGPPAQAVIQTSKERTSHSKCTARSKKIIKQRSNHSKRLAALIEKHRLNMVPNKMLALCANQDKLQQRPGVQAIGGGGFGEQEFYSAKYAPRVRDEWDLAYDKGKTKRVREKRQPLRIDFDSMRVFQA